MKKIMLKKSIVAYAVIILVLSACQSTIPEIVEVTRQVTVEVPVVEEVEVTRLVEVEIEKEVEVTRLVEVEVETVTSTSLVTSGEEFDPSVAFSANYLGEVEQSNIKVELVRIIIMHRDALKPKEQFDDVVKFNNHEYVAEIIWRITNNSDASISWNAGDINVRINKNQISLDDWFFESQRNIGESPTDPIFPGSTIIGGLWVGIGRNITLNEISSISFLLDGAFDAENYNSVSEKFIITGDLSGQHEWVALPDEFK